VLANGKLPNPAQISIFRDCSNSFGYRRASRLMQLVREHGSSRRMTMSAARGTLNLRTLGGLVEVSRRFDEVLKNALERQRLCSGDPVCADHDPATAADDRTLHGAACHGCLVIAETSCEARNLFLDRALLVDTVGPSGCGYFEAHQAQG
jgi:hypothetical protein